MNLIIILCSVFTIVLCQYPAFEIDKPGACPPALPQSRCMKFCNTDMHCEGSYKCCATACGGTTCSEPVTEREYGTKPGYCPLYPTGPWVCTSRCTTDNDCSRNHKCCRNRCGALACTAPTQNFGQ